MSSSRHPEHETRTATAGRSGGSSAHRHHPRDSDNDPDPRSDHDHRHHRHEHRSSSRKRSPDPHDDRDRDRDRKSSRSHRHADRSTHHDTHTRDEGTSRRHRDHHHRDRDADRSSHRHSTSSSKRRETSEERRERKAAKRAKRRRELDEYKLDDDDEDSAVAQRTAAAELMMYSAEDNPFNDANLGQKFTWGKKEEKDRKLGLSKREAELRDAQRRQEAMAEIEKLNAKRAEREREAAIREEEEARMARLAESAQMAEWVAKEDDFYLEQSKRRAAIRIRENRAKPIDILSINLKWADPHLGHRNAGKAAQLNTSEAQDVAEDADDVVDDDDDDDDEAGLEIDLEEPYNIFENLTLEETQELHQDVKMYLSLEKVEANLEFWRSMLIVCDDKLDELREAAGQDAPGGSFAPGSRLDAAEKTKINDMLSVKSTDELMTLQEQVRSKLASGEPVDVEYWERVLKSIVVWRAKAKLRDMHEVVLSNRIEYLQRKQRDEALRQQRNLLSQLGDDAVRDQKDADRIAAVDQSLQAERDAAEAAELEGLYDADEMEPEPVDYSKLRYDDRQLPVYTVEEDRKRIVEARRRVVGAAFIPRARGDDSIVGDDGDPAMAMFRKEANRALDVEEETFNADENLARRVYQWEDKYRPRKPRYFNRVHTGYEWNKYNQTHYDTDNPPPKIVQGYKFNIFYPDLIDKSVAPTYKIIKEPDNQDTVLLRFTAGPPYEDIAFRIVNREWEYSHRRGFRSSFDRGILQLYFNFKRLRYRK
ncbi:uncharacterized protein PFL1_05797 [Pseudozyma flocculosa PF-1]|uniref:Splicing factor Cactin n=2 Tax=Pseudozyma flocculosa TaxID=84751 RepID=A0A5C3F549_9BASI|nr:uncharacterized protein PFL1_05797 [Pseudozyma flocculosa PF-1]EPQ26475.1 hypothetical protein PFL1_05797 [Pseudozyma flocculosa PF-1]SPO38539.1 related to cactin [Pseudozyma flocculosa]